LSSNVRRVEILLVLLVAGLLYFNYINQETILAESIRTIKEFHWLKLSGTYNKESTIQIDFLVTEGGPVDLFVFNKSGYNEFYYIMTTDKGIFMPIISEFNVKSANIQFEVPADELFYVIINNALIFSDNEIPMGDVTTSIKISSRN